MKKIIDLLGSRKILFKKIRKIELKKRKLYCYEGVDLKDFYHLVFIRYAKSKLFFKDAKMLLEELEQVQSKEGINYKKISLFYKSACKKALIYLREEGFKSYDFV